jgi:hypothetical protein
LAACGARAATICAGGRIFGTRSPESDAELVAAVRKRLGEAGFVDGRNMAIEFRWAEANNGRALG